MPLSSIFMRSSNVNMSCLILSASSGFDSSIASRISDFHGPVHLVEHAGDYFYSAETPSFH